MLKHSYHARLSIWHVVLLVIILAISLPVIAQPLSPSTLPPVKLALDDKPQWQQTGTAQLAGDRLHIV